MRTTPWLLMLMGSVFFCQCETRPHDYDLKLSNVAATRDASNTVTVQGSISCVGLGGFDCGGTRPIAPIVAAAWVAPSGMTANNCPSRDCAIQGPSGITLYTTDNLANQQLGNTPPVQRVSGNTWAFTLPSPDRVPVDTSIQIIVEVSADPPNGGDKTVIQNP